MVFQMLLCDDCYENVKCKCYDDDYDKDIMINGLLH
jgi:hypothetical protein